MFIFAMSCKYDHGSWLETWASCLPNWIFMIRGLPLSTLFIENMPLESEVGVGIKQLIYRLYIMCF